MSNNNCYSNFVKAVTPKTSTVQPEVQPYLSGDEARKLYLEEIKDAKNTQLVQRSLQQPHQRALNIIENVSIKDLFLSAENNDLDTLKNILDSFPNLLNQVDDFGWSLLMIACQANSVEAAEELLKRGIDTTVRDRAGNSARSLVIRNKNLVLADLFLSHKQNTETPVTNKSEDNNIICSNKQSSKKSFNCDICNSTFPNREDHLSSTIHNISASKDKKIPTNYVIPQTNKGYQLMVKGGWDRDTGLGRDGKGKKYPIKTVQKIDRKGLGHKKKLEHKDITETVKVKHKKFVNREKRHSRRFERNFRREFY